MVGITSTESPVAQQQGFIDLGGLSGLSQFMQYSGQIKAIMDAATSNEEIGTKIKQIAPPLVNILEGVASVMYPGLAPAIKIAAGALATFDPNATKWLQSALNQYLDINLTTDGYIGPATIAAVKQAQEKLGIVPDGFAGKITYAALAGALALGKKSA